MPTGYTSELYDGKKKVTFQKFAMECARAFGALVMLRDEPSAEIPEEFKPSPYYAEKLAEATKRLEKARRLTPMKADIAARSEYAKALSAWEFAKQDKAALEARYRAMLEEAVRWTPPTKDHRGLKAFMVEQLETSIKHDCGMEYYDKPKPKTAAQFMMDQIAKAERDVAYYTEAKRKEEERVAGRNAWVKALRESLTITESAGDPT